MVGTRTAARAAHDPYAPELNRRTRKRPERSPAPSFVPDPASGSLRGTLRIVRDHLPPAASANGNLARLQSLRHHALQAHMQQAVLQVRPSTTMWSARTNRRSKARPAMPRCSISDFVSS